MNAEIQNMIGVLIHVAKSDEFLDHEEKKVLKNIIYRYLVDSEDLKKIKSTQENLSEKLLKVKTPENKELVVKLSALIIASDGMITDVEKKTFKNIRNFLGEKEYKYKFENDDFQLVTYPITASTPSNNLLKQNPASSHLAP